jgi:hypothetical protein
MDWIIWLVVIVVIVAIVWWLLKRNSRASSGSAGSGTAAATAPAPAKETPAAAEAAPAEVAAAAPEAPAAASAPAEASAAAKTEPAVAADKAEWETQWSETPPAEPHPAIHNEGARSAAGAHGAHVMEGAQPTDLQPGKDAATADSTAGSAAKAIPVHHREYTEPHAPTLPGAESAAAEAAFAADAGAAAEPAGHLALEQPYGEGSAASAADGSGPQGFTVKGSAASMIYYDETSPVFEETQAEVWFVSIAHAEAAGFRPPRRSRQ